MPRYRVVRFGLKTPKTQDLYVGDDRDLAESRFCYWLRRMKVGELWLVENRVVVRKGRARQFFEHPGQLNFVLMYSQ